MKNILSKKLVFFLSFIFLSSNYAFTKESHDLLKYRGMFYTIDQILEDYFDDIKPLKTPIRSLLSDYKQSENLPPEFRRVFLSKILSGSSKSNIKLLDCIECTSIKAQLEDDEFVLKSGLTDNKELKEVLKKNKTDYYSSISIDKTENELTLTINVYNNKTKELYFSKEYQNPIYVLKTSGLSLSVNGAVMIVNNSIPSSTNKLFGAQLSFGQKIENLGDFGLNLGSFLGDDKKLLLSVGLYLNPNFNDMTGGYWRFGSLIGMAKLGVTMSSGTSVHIHTGLGLKLKIGSFFYLYSESRFFIKLKQSTDNKKNATDILNFGKKVPVSAIIGVGIDVG